jgi:competence protein ComEC
MRWNWKNNPALLVGLQLLLGASFFWNYDWYFAFSALLLCLPFCFFKSRSDRIALLTLTITFLIGMTLGKANFIKVEQYNLPLHGTALIKPHTIKEQKSFFQSSYLCEGTILKFCSEKKTLMKNLPCIIHLSPKDPKPDLSSIFSIDGVLEKIQNQKGYFHAEKNWRREANSFSLSKARTNCKKKFLKAIQKRFPNKKESSFIFALSTGEIEDKMMMKDFAQCGLQHILAVSGFHFGILALFGHYFFTIFLSKKRSLIALFCLITIYFIFLGLSPSVLRAWLAISVWIIGRLLNKKNQGLNTLGICLIIEILINPCSIFHLGFQLSFLCTLALLLLTPDVLKGMQTIFPKRTQDDLRQLSHLDKIGYLACSFLRHSSAITISVHLASIPVCLYYFSTFPLLSLIYNLFFPILVSLCMMGFMIGCILYLIFPLASIWIDHIISHLSHLLITTTQYPPIAWNIQINVPSISKDLIVLYLLVVFILFSSFRAKPQINVV